ncbi:uncharacterized protein N7469_010529 [Penicillium citrinum]|uniref:Rhodopsin domain-containing protein n=2 Tax=Penicillium TaxID=5073 RepID=A0A9W9TG63_PENCI|nr:uncharacterized protein N7469_010529 [Penicillium citrinum]KAJ5221642.1 hypothetical protein N7469_010529 [Penicillium citrinum]KAJ5596608.1 hypothetical protein N7450_003066 [Penicillium hetheringtonii]
MALTAENENDDKGPKILAVIWTLTTLTLLMVTARIFIRLKMLKNFGIDDYLIVVSMVLSLAYCGVTTASIAYGFGQHAMKLSQYNMEMAILLNSLSFLCGILSFTVPKLAVTAMLTRILNPGLPQKIWLWTLVSLAAAVSCICIIILFTMCDPPEALWHVHLVATAGAKCRDVWILVNYAIFTGCLSAFVDLYLALYPVSVLMKLHMSLRKRLALCAALGLGSIACAMAIIKCTQLQGLADKSDYTYGTADLVMWTNIEADVVIIASCIPTLQPLLELVLGKRTLGSYSNGQSGPYKNSGSNWNTASFDRSKKSAARKDDLVVTNVDSQESILPADGNKDQFQRNNNKTFPMGAIRRTDDVTVEYEANSTHGANSQSSW